LLVSVLLSLFLHSTSRLALVLESQHHIIIFVHRHEFTKSKQKYSLDMIFEYL
jgi:hypothetical protein